MGPESQIEGAVPHLEGKVCEGILAWQLSYCGEVVDPAHLVFLQVAGEWFQLHLDYERVYWRSICGPPVVHFLQDNNLSFDLVDLAAGSGLKGKVILGFEAGPYRRAGPGCHATLEFAGDNRRRLMFSNVRGPTGCVLGSTPRYGCRPLTAAEWEEWRRQRLAAIPSGISLSYFRDLCERLKGCAKCGCKDGSHARLAAREWIGQTGLAAREDEILRWLKSVGGDCDCTIQGRSNRLLQRFAEKEER